MSTLSSKLKLTLPSLNDEIHQTIQDLAVNFQKIDDAAESYVSQIPTSGYYRQNSRIWNSTPHITQYVGWVNTREGQAAPVWRASMNYVVGDYVAPANNNGHYYECIQSGRSGVIEPTFTTVSGDTVSDTKNGAQWKPSQHYNMNDIVFPFVPNNRFYVCTASGASGPTEPAWSLVDGGSTTDGGAVWTGYRIVRWREKGISCDFRPFGKIE